MGVAHGTDSHHGTGHRARLRTRLLEAGGDSLLDHELVEYILALAIPRKDTKPLAKQLLAHYGGFSALLTADTENIVRQAGMGETSTAALKIVQAAALRLLSEPVREQIAQQRMLVACAGVCARMRVCGFEIGIVSY